MKMKLGALSAAALFLAGGAHAADWNMDREASLIGFVATYDEIPFEGRFRDFSAEIAFDPDGLENGSFIVVVDIATVDSDSPDRDEGMLEGDWFDAGRFPQATFTSTGFERRSADGEFAVTGALTIKGVTRSITAPFKWATKGPGVRLQGTADVKRGHFNIGTGDWADDATIGFDVSIIFDLALSR